MFISQVSSKFIQLVWSFVGTNFRNNNISVLLLYTIIVNWTLLLVNKVQINLQ